MNTVIRLTSSLLCFLLCWAAGASDVITLTPGSELIDASTLKPYEVSFLYHRPETAEPGVGTRVTWRLERIGKQDSDYGRESFKTTLITHADAQDYFDINQFDAMTFEHIATDIPTMTADGKLADIHFSIQDRQVSGDITPRGDNPAADEISKIDVPLERRVMGGGDAFFATLPLESGKRYTWPAFDIQNQAIKWETAEVRDQETIATVKGVVSAWVVITRGGDGKLWINKQPPYVYRREFKRDGKPFLVWELAD